MSSPIPVAVIIAVTVSRHPIAPMAWTDAPAPAPAPTHSVSVPAVPPKQLSSELPPNYLDVHKITVTPTITVILFVLPTRGFAKISDWGELSNNRPTGIEPPLKCLDGSSRLVLLLELNIHVSDHVVGEVVTDVKAFDLTELAELLENVLVKLLEVLLELAGFDWLALGVHSGGNHIRAMVHVGQQYGWGDRRPVVEP